MPKTTKGGRGLDPSHLTSHETGPVNPNGGNPGQSYVLVSTLYRLVGPADRAATHSKNTGD